MSTYKLMFFAMEMNYRFKKERERLKLTQAFIADLFGISTQAVSKWEKSGTIPIEKIAVLARHGFDAQYIVTGVRSTNLNQVTTPTDSNSLDSRMSKLTETQQDMIKMMIEELERADERARIAKDFARQVRENGNGNGKK